MSCCVNWTTNSTGCSGFSYFPALDLLSSLRDSVVLPSVVFEGVVILGNNTGCVLLCGFTFTCLEEWRGVWGMEMIDVPDLHLMIKNGSGAQVCGCADGLMGCVPERLCCTYTGWGCALVV